MKSTKLGHYRAGGRCLTALCLPEVGLPLYPTVKALATADGLFLLPCGHSAVDFILLKMRHRVPQPLFK